MTLTCIMSPSIAKDDIHQPSPIMLPSATPPDQARECDGSKARLSVLPNCCKRESAKCSENKLCSFIQ